VACICDFNNRDTFPSLMSGSVRITDSSRASRHVGFVPEPDSCTAANSILLDHFVGTREQRRGYLQAERNRRNQVDDQLELYRLLHR
jgi:hypothetical protein